MTISPNLRRFLSLIGYSEGADYNTIVTGADGKPETFSDFSHHPFENREPKLIRPGLKSTAAGKYQILYRFWKAYQEQLHLPDFGPESQDRVAIQLITECGALPNIAAGDVQSAVLKCASRWASFPSNNYHQGGKSMQQLVDFWNKEEAQ